MSLMCARIVGRYRTMEYYARPVSRVRAPPVAILREKRPGLLQGIAELRWSYAHRPPKYLSKMATLEGQ